MIKLRESRYPKILKGMSYKSTVRSVTSMYDTLQQLYSVTVALREELQRTKTELNRRRLFGGAGENEWAKCAATMENIVGAAGGQQDGLSAVRVIRETVERFNQNDESLRKYIDRKIKAAAVSQAYERQMQNKIDSLQRERESLQQQLEKARIREIRRYIHS